MDQLNLNIHDARIITSSSQFTLDTYIVLDTDGDSIGDNPKRVKQIRDGLTEALRNPDDYPTIIQRRVPRQLKHFAFAPQVTIHNDAQRPVRKDFPGVRPVAAEREDRHSGRTGGRRVLRHRCAEPTAIRSAVVQSSAGRHRRTTERQLRTDPRDDPPEYLAAGHEPDFD